MNGKLRPREPHLPSLLFRVHLLISEPTSAFQLRVLWDKLLPLVEVSPCATFFSYSDSQTAARNWVCMMVVGLAWSDSVKVGHRGGNFLGLKDESVRLMRT